MIIYKITNKINNKVYIGQTILSPMRRWNIHKNRLRKINHSNCHLQSSWIKYGEENFTFEIIESILWDRNYLDEREKYWIQFYNSISQENGYNIESGGNLKKECSSETRIKLSNTSKGRKHTPESIAMISASKKGRPHTLETRLKLSESRKGKSPSAETRAKLSEANKGHKVSTETRLKISNSKKGKIKSEETKLRMSAAQQLLSKNRKK